MINLSYTQEFALFVLNKTNHTSTFAQNTAYGVCLITGGILELLTAEILELNEKESMIVAQPLPESLSYLQPLYADISNQKKPIAVNSYVQNALCKTNALLAESVCKSLADAGCVDRVEKEGLFGIKVRYKVLPEKLDPIIQKIRAEILEDGELADETTILTILLNASSLLKVYFSKYESDKMNARLADLKNNSNNVFIKNILNNITTTMAAAVMTMNSH